MSDSQADILLHPVRLRIVQALDAGGQLTVQEIGRMLKDVPQASLYRHLNRLVDGGFVQMVDERPVGGAMERIYAVADGAGVLTEDDLKHASKTDHMRYFTAFCAMLMSKFDQYLNREPVNLPKDGVGYRTRSLHLTDEEFHRLMKAIDELLEEAAHNEPAPDRRSRLIATVTMVEEHPALEPPNHLRKGRIT